MKKHRESINGGSGANTAKLSKKESMILNKNNKNMLTIEETKNIDLEKTPMNNGNMTDLFSINMNKEKAGNKGRFET